MKENFHIWELLKWKNRISIFEILWLKQWIFPFIYVRCTDLFQQWHHERKNGNASLKDVQAMVPVEKRRIPPFIKLANESPLRGTESEEPAYDSFNEQETGTWLWLFRYSFFVFSAVVLV